MTFKLYIMTKRFYIVTIIYYEEWMVIEIGVFVYEINY
jgi:hypothetical protein